MGSVLPIELATVDPSSQRLVPCQVVRGAGERCNDFSPDCLESVIVEY